MSGKPGGWEPLKLLDHELREFRRQRTWVRAGTQGIGLYRGRWRGKGKGSESGIGRTRGQEIGTPMLSLPRTPHRPPQRISTPPTRPRPQPRPPPTRRVRATSKSKSTSTRSWGATTTTTDPWPCEYGGNPTPGQQTPCPLQRTIRIRRFIPTTRITTTSQPQQQQRQQFLEQMHMVIQHEMPQTEQPFSISTMDQPAGITTCTASKRSKRSRTSRRSKRYTSKQARREQGNQTCTICTRTHLSLYLSLYIYCQGLYCQGL